MVLAEMTRIFERRRTELYDLLDQRKEELKPEVQHQMYGAMNEIDIFLKTIEYYKQKEMDSEIQNAVLVGPMIREGMVTKIMGTLNKRVKGIKHRKKRK
ncbi:hypothetical protein GOV08_03885 [Candidatus Woesearchaeota archaeon]|nr:hypothetical protein [Candidatus Woesearchaeota archaeon]